MDQHPIPRQITTFEFKLVGFLTIKQFIYLIVFIGLGLAVYALTPIPILNYLFGVLTGSVGLAFAFVPINDRPMEVWVKNLIKRLTSPTQYKFQKQNKPIKVLIDLALENNPQQIAAHIDSQKKLNSYLSAKSSQEQNNNKKQAVNDLLTSPLTFLTKKKPTASQPITSNQSSVTSNQSPATSHQSPVTKHPFITGVVKNFKLAPLGGILIYVKKNMEDSPIRIFKSNLHGVFLSYNPLSPGDYIFEVKDPKKVYLFDTIKIKVENENKPIEIKSKELI